MSYPYGQFPGENYTSPTTPHDPFPQWETVEHEQQQLEQQQQQAQQHQRQQIESEIHSPVHATPQYQTIQLEESQPGIHGHDIGPVRLQNTRSLQRHEGRSEITQSGDAEPLSIDIDTPHPIITSRRASPAAGLTRTGRPHIQHQMHPYRRPQSAAGASRQVSQPREQHLRFVQGGGGPSTGAMPSPIVPSPAGRMVSFGSSVNSPVVGMPSALLAASPRPIDSAPRRRSYLICSDFHYNRESGLLTAMLELPGVKKSDVSVTLSTCYYNRVRQVTVRGHTRPVFPVQTDTGSGGGLDMTLRERKFGEFARTFPVPSDIKREDIDASMEDGVLTLKIPCGKPAESEDVQDIIIR